MLTTMPAPDRFARSITYLSGLTADDLPPTPFQILPGERVVDAPLLLAATLDRLALGYEQAVATTVAIHAVASPSPRAARTPEVVPESIPEKIEQQAATEEPEQATGFDGLGDGLDF